METPQTYELLKKVLKKLYELEERVERLETDAPRFLSDDSDYEDPLYEEVKVFVSEQYYITASVLQKHFQVGYARAARFLDLLEVDGIIEPYQEGTMRRRVIKKDDFVN